MITLLLALVCLCALALAVARRSDRVADGMIQSLTHHGSHRFVLPPSPEYELVTLHTKDGTKIFSQGCGGIPKTRPGPCGAIIACGPP